MLEAVILLTAVSAHVPVVRAILRLALGSHSITTLLLERLFDEGIFHDAILGVLI